MTASVLRCVTVLARSSTLSCCPDLLSPEDAITLGPNGRGKQPVTTLWFEIDLNLLFRIFRTDYGHTEVAAHFGNG